MSQFLTARQLAERWHKSTNTLANWRVLGKGPKWIQPGGRRCLVLYPLEEIERHEAALASTSEAYARG